MLPELMLSDQHRLNRRIDRARGLRDQAAQDKAIAQLAADVARAAQRITQRKAALPEISYPEELPVSQRKDDLAKAISEHQVVIVAGETGSGKTTQLPKICLEIGRGITGQIGHTQPRRLAARTVAERIAEELHTTLGDAVGYKVRFTDKSSDSTLVKLMTDGILLNEIASDRDLYRYDTLIIDEAHERSLNIDFILGYLKQLLPRRPDLKVIITSATIDPERFAAHFDNAPIVEVSGRTYPVEVRYRPVSDPEQRQDEDRDQVQAISDAIDELAQAGPGDILVFLSGEREIRDTADAFKGRKNLDVLPLYGRLSAAEQHRVFEPPTSRLTRRVVLATNVAETSLTVPGIRYVIDPGTARISRYSLRTKVQRLPIEPISQASANQRKGRCGRVADGICIRLYSEEDFASRPEYTDPEIQRTNLASVILQMAAARLGDVRAFPFVDPPDPRSIADGVRLLEELNAMTSDRLTELGRKMARLPVDPRIARMILESDSRGCAREVLVIAAALSIQDPRERPTDNQQAADTAAPQVRPARVGLPHVRRPLGLPRRAPARAVRLRLPAHVPRRVPELPAGPRMAGPARPAAKPVRRPRGQDRHIVGRTGGGSHRPARRTPVPCRHEGGASRRPAPHRRAGPPPPDRLPRRTRHALRDLPRFRARQETAGLGSRRRTRRDLPPVGRIVAAVEPEWVEPVAAHLVRRAYSEPRWSKQRGAVIATEKVTLYGIPIIADRTVNYARIDPETSRELFVRHALVEGDWETRHHFFRDNAAVLAEAAELEQRTRRRGLVAGEDALFEFYDARVPSDVVSARHFDAWWKKARHITPDLLTPDDAGPAQRRGRRAGLRRLPRGVDLRVTRCRGRRAAPRPGAVLRVRARRRNRRRHHRHPAEHPQPGPPRGILLAGARPAAGTGDRADPVAAQGGAPRARPGPRRGPRGARRARGCIPPGDIRDVLSRELFRLRGVRVAADEFDLDKLPSHLRITFRILDHGRSARHGQGPRRPAAATAAQAARHAVRPGERPHQDRADELGLRRRCRRSSPTAR